MKYWILIYSHDTPWHTDKHTQKEKTNTQTNICKCAASPILAAVRVPAATKKKKIHWNDALHCETASLPCRDGVGTDSILCGRKEMHTLITVCFYYRGMQWNSLFRLQHGWARKWNNLKIYTNKCKSYIRRMVTRENEKTNKQWIAFIADCLPSSPLFAFLCSVAANKHINSFMIDSLAFFILFSASPCHWQSDSWRCKSVCFSFPSISKLKIKGG